MSWVLWMLVGSITGILAHFPVKRPVRAVLLDVGLGVLGAGLGGSFFNAHRGVDMMALTPNSTLFALLGAVVVLTLYHSIFYRRSGSTRR